MTNKPSKTLLAALILTATIISTTLTLLTGYQTLTTTYLGEGDSILVVSQVGATTPLTSTIKQDVAQSLLAVRGVTAASPETLQLLILDGQTVHSRGITTAFHQLQPLEIRAGTTPLEHELAAALVGHEAAERLNLHVDDWMTARGVYKEGMIELKVTGIYATGLPLDQEILIPLEAAKPLAFGSQDAVTLIRLLIDPKTLDQEALQTAIDDIPSPAYGPAPTYIQSYLGDAASPILFAALAILAVVILLSTITSTAIVSSTIHQQRTQIGIAQALGATPRRIIRTRSLTILATSLAAGTLAYLAGLGLSYLLTETQTILLGGHAPIVTIDLRILAATIAITATVAILASTSTLSHLAKLRPIENLRTAPLLANPPNIALLKTTIKLSTLAFAIGLLIRTIPEILMGPYPVGYDPMAYELPTLHLITQLGPIPEALLRIQLGPFLFTALTTLHNLTQQNLVLAFKLLPPLTHGLLGAAIYLYANRALKWNPKHSLLLAFTITTAFATLRLSWDLMKNHLALALAPIALLLYHKADTWKNAALASAMTLIIVATHPFVTLLTLISALALTAAKGKRWTNKRILALIPPTLGFIYYVDSLQFSLLGAPSLGLPYLLQLLLYLYLPLTPLAIIGLKGAKDPAMITWGLFTLTASLMPAIAPALAPTIWWRWPLLLVLPVAYLSVQGVRNLKHPRLKGAAAAYLVATLLVLAHGYTTQPNEHPMQYYVRPEYDRMPTSMLQNTVPSTDAPDVVAALQWLNQNHGDGKTALLVDEVFNGWVALYTDPNEVTPVPAKIRALPSTASEIHEEGYRVYTIWWVPGAGWHGVETLPQDQEFQIAHQSGRMAIYSYHP